MVSQANLFPPPPQPSDSVPSIARSRSRYSDTCYGSIAGTAGHSDPQTLDPRVRSTHARSTADAECPRLHSFAPRRASDDDARRSGLSCRPGRIDHVGASCRVGVSEPTDGLRHFPSLSIEEVAEQDRAFDRHETTVGLRPATIDAREPTSERDSA